MGRMATPRRPRDTNQLAKLIVALSTGDQTDPISDAGKDPTAVARGRAGGLRGGVARRKSLSKSRREQIARKAAKARWGVKKA